ncbi:MAG TPA: peptidyl-prolyl cis-trans isomerase [Alphaproteobacteria bacterium]|nr:peptidyl-prolyl cis-trans isomerase [Alphaproteobacteria bacterium]
MLHFFRKLGETKPAKVMLVVLAMSFGAWGVGEYLTNQLGNEALSVDGEGVSVGQAQRAYDQSLKRVQQMLGGQPVPPALLAQMNIGPSVVNDLVHRLVLRHTARDLALIPATAQLRDEISAIPNFHQNGVFNLSRYQQSLASNGMSTSEFEHEMGKDLSVRLLSELVATPSPTAAAVRPLSALVHSTLTLNVLAIGPASLPTPPAITDNDLEQFYKANPSLGTIAEKRSFNVLVLDSAELAKSLTVTDEQVEKDYNLHKAEYALPEQRRVRHVLVNSEVVAKRMAGEIKNLKDLEKAAREHTLDPGSKSSGGDLGLIAKKDVVATFGDVAFGLKVGEISAPVKSPFGWHIIGVESIEPPHQQPLSAVKDKIADALRRQLADQTMVDLANQIADAVAAGDTLDKIAGQKGLKLQRYSLIEPGAEHPDSNIMAVAFKTGEGDVSEPINLPRNGLAYVQVTKVQAASQRPLAQIKDNVLKAAKQAQQQAGLLNAAQNVLTAARKPGSGGLEQVARNLNVHNATMSSLTMGPANPAPDWLKDKRGDVLSLPVNGVLDVPLQVGDEMRLVQVTGRQLADPTQEEANNTANAYTQQLQAQTETMLIDYLTRQSRVKLNKQRLDGVFGTTPNTVEQ